MDDEDYKVSSELYEERDYESTLKPTFNENNIVSIFKFQVATKRSTIDADGDMDVQRRSSKETLQIIEIEHSKRTALNLVGLQVWRGALLLADWLIYNNETLPKKTILEVGSGVGLTSIVAAMYRPVLCTDINVGGILELIQQNVKRNGKIQKESVKVMELNFLNEFSNELKTELDNVEVVLAADVIYDDTITEAFVNCVKMLLSVPSTRSIYVALEKRYVFTITDCDSVAPCYEYFLECINKLNNIKLEELKLDFPQYFQYDRVKELVLLRISN